MKNVTQKSMDEKNNRYKNNMIKDSQLVYAGGYAIIEAIHWQELAETIKDIKSFDSQFCICLLYSIELYFKSILLNLRKNITVGKKRHSIFDMYNDDKVTDDMRKCIKENIKIDKNIKISLRDEYISFKSFEEELEYISNDFCYLRYEYEKFLNGKPLVLLSEFILALCENVSKVAININTKSQKEYFNIKK